MKDYLIDVAEMIEEQTGRDFDDILVDIMDGVYGTTEEIFRRFPPKN